MAASTEQGEAWKLPDSSTRGAFSQKSVTEEDWREVCLECLPGRKKKKVGDVNSDGAGSSPQAKRQKVSTTDEDDGEGEASPV